MYFFIFGFGVVLMLLVWIRAVGLFMSFDFWNVCVFLLDLVYLCGLRGGLGMLCWFWVWFSVKWYVWGWYKTQTGVVWVFYLCLCFLLLVVLSFLFVVWSCWVSYVFCLYYFVLYVMGLGIFYVLCLICFCLWWFVVCFVCYVLVMVLVCLGGGWAF